MKYSTAIIAAAALLAASVSSVPIRRDVDPSLIPILGFHSGVNPTGTGDCDGAVKGANGQPIKVPCQCPPDQATFNALLNANVAAGQVINNPSIKAPFPTDNSKASQAARIETALVTLQNIHGPGEGCPAASTTLVAQQAAVNAKRDAAPSASEITSLAPQIGFSAGLNPTGTGDCDGAVAGPDGKPIKIPCACPPSQSDFNAALVANVQAGKAIHNPTVAVTFPTDNSNASKIARLNAGLITFQNLHGPGQGCPAVSSTFQAQQKALQ